MAQWVKVLAAEADSLGSKPKPTWGGGGQESAPAHRSAVECLYTGVSTRVHTHTHTHTHTETHTTSKVTVSKETLLEEPLEHSR
jgi:carbohydrate-binding DOMON domain-containing protein